MLHGKVKQIPDGTSVRWLSVEAAVKMIFQSYDAIVLALEEDKDGGKAEGLYKFLATSLFVLFNALIVDVLTVIGVLSLTFQKDSVNLSCLKHSVNSTKATLNAMKNGSTKVDEVLNKLGNAPLPGQKVKIPRC